MIRNTLLLAAATALTLGAVAQAQPLPEYDPGRPNKAVPADSAAQSASASEFNWIGSMVYAYDGREAGRIERVVTTVPGGDPTQIALRVKGKEVLIPAGSIRIIDGQAISSLSITQMEDMGTPPGR